MNLVTLGEEAAAVSAVLGLVWWIWVKVLRVKWRRFKESCKSFAELPAAVSTLSDVATGVASGVDELRGSVHELRNRITSVEYEVKPNGGTNLRGAVERLQEANAIASQSTEYFLNESGVAAFRTDASGLCVYVNRFYSKLVGRTPEECLAHGWRNCLEPENAGDVITHWQRCVRDQREFSMVVKYQLPGGDTICCRVQAYVLRSQQGNYVGHQGFVKPQVCEGCEDGCQQE